MANHICFTVADRSYFSLLKKEIHGLATKAGFSNNKVGEIDIIVAEIVSNLVKHGNGGKLLVKLIRHEGIDGIEFISIDNGNGIIDINKMMVDGMSTTNTLGQGLGAIKRLSNVFQVFTQKGWGTVLLARVFNDEIPYKKRRNEVRSIVVPKPGEEKCGDGFYCQLTNDHARMFLGDGLGHGEMAELAVQMAIEAFKETDDTNPVDIIRFMHNRVRKTRGLVGAVAIFSFKEKKWRMCGVGNINTRILTGIEVKSYMAYNGIIGYNMPNTINYQEMDYESGQVIVMCSDGIKTRWDHSKYPSLLKHDLSVFSSVLLKDFGRYTDDMSIAAVRLNF